MEKLILVEDAVLRDTFWNAAVDLKKENDELKQRIKRLEEACRDMVSEEDTHIRLQTWLEAKEVQP
jgi:hypothetical protein